MAVCKLEKASWSLVDQILEKLKSDSPDTLVGYNTLKTHYYIQKCGRSNLDLTLLTPGGTVDEYGTYAILNLLNGNNWLFYSNHPKPERMLDLIENCDYINWNEKILIGPVVEKFFPALQNLIKKQNLQQDKEELSSYTIDPEAGKKLTTECPAEVYMAPVREEHAELINSIWPHRSEHSIIWVTEMVKILGGIGIFLKDTNELISWTLRSPFNGPGLLQTVESHKRKGYGRVVAAEMTKKLCQENGDFSLVFITEHNVPSQTLFKNLGYKRGCSICWVDLKPMQ